MEATFPKGRVVVTGGAGFIGSAVVAGLNAAGVEDILVVDRLDTTDKWMNLRALRFRDYVEADVFRAGVAAGRWGRPAVVFHLGANSATTERDAGHLMDNNFAFTKEVARWAVGYSARFVYASSAATYGGGEAGLEDRDDAEHLARLRPLNAYGYSKHLLDCWARREGLLERVVGLKYFNVFGPNEAHKGEMRSLVHKAFGQIQATGVVRLFRSHRPDFRDGEQRRDFLYVKDAVAATLHFAAGGVRAAGLFNVGSGTARTWLDLAQAIFAALGREPRIEFVDMPVELRDRYQYHTCADVTKLRASGYVARFTPLEDAVKDYVQQYLLPGRFLGDRASE